MVSVEIRTLTSSYTFLSLCGGFSVEPDVFLDFVCVRHSTLPCVRCCPHYSYSKGFLTVTQRLLLCIGG